SNIDTVQFVGLGTTYDVLVGGLRGVFRMVSTDPGKWTKFGLNLPNAVTTEVDYNAADDVLLAGTLGRGAWTIGDASTGLRNPEKAVEGASQTYNLGSFSDSSLGVWLVDVKWGDGTTDTTFLATPGSLGTRPHTFGEEGNYTVTVTVTNLLSSSSDSKTFP